MFVFLQKKIIKEDLLLQRRVGLLDQQIVVFPLSKSQSCGPHKTMQISRAIVEHEREGKILLICGLLIIFQIIFQILFDKRTNVVEKRKRITFSLA